MSSIYEIESISEASVLIGETRRSLDLLDAEIKDSIKLGMNNRLGVALNVYMALRLRERLARLHAIRERIKERETR